MLIQQDGDQFIASFLEANVNASGESGNSPEASARPMASAPGEISVSAAEENQLQITWLAGYTGWLLQIQTNAPGVGLGSDRHLALFLRDGARSG